MLTLPRALIAIAFASASTTSVAGAQELAPVAARYSAGPPDTTRRLAPQRTGDSGLDAASRVMFGVVGGFVGSYEGAVIGARTASGCHGELCNLDNAIAGAAIGSVIGSAILSSLPGFDNRCGFVQRLATATAGSLVGALAGGVTGMTMGAGGVLIGYWAGSAIGGGMGASVCS